MSESELFVVLEYLYQHKDDDKKFFSASELYNLIRPKTTLSSAELQQFIINQVAHGSFLYVNGFRNVYRISDIGENKYNELKKDKHWKDIKYEMDKIKFFFLKYWWINTALSILAGYIIKLLTGC